MKWLPERSTQAVREALLPLGRGLCDAEIRLRPWAGKDDPLWCRGTAFLGEDWVVKFTWTEPAALKLEREAKILRALARAPSPPPMPELIAESRDPVLLVHRRVRGGPVTAAALERCSPAQRRELADSLAQVLAQLHAPALRDSVLETGLELRPPVPQANTQALRERLCPLLDPGSAERVRRWCDWVDDQLASSVPPVLLHGDFHGMNLLLGGWSVRAVLDFEEAALGDRCYDFRYLPAQARNVELLLETVAAYSRATQAEVDVHRVMAWHIRTVLGDALWRTEAAIGLPGGGTPSSWVDQLGQRLATLRSGPDRL
jgi:aminoglycoside phosphotransferase (APT) family kinase protein